jgi:uncharacterized membrane protein
MSAIEATVVIKRPVDEVFRFYTDFSNLPAFLGDVMAIEQIGPTTSRWTIQGPLGIEVKWTVEVTEKRTNEVIHYETITSSAVKTRWAVYFARRADPGETEVREVMETPFGEVGRVALSLIGKPPAEEMSANLHRLKEIMETGRVMDTRHAVSGKFGHAR